VTKLKHFKTVTAGQTWIGIRTEYFEMMMTTTFM